MFCVLTAVTCAEHPALHSVGSFECVPRVSGGVLCDLRLCALLCHVQCVTCLSFVFCVGICNVFCTVCMVCALCRL